MKSPIVIFAYNRPRRFKELVNSLKQNIDYANHEIFVFIDGPKKEEDKTKIKEVKEIAQTLTNKIITSEKNRGLAASIITGVSEVVNKYGEVIVLEDDLILHPNFLNFMEEGLRVFREDKRIISICGFGLKIQKPRNYNHEIYLAKRSSSWGWATWKDRWNHIDWEVKDFENLKSSSKLRSQFNEGGSDLYGMLKDYMEGKNNSWAIRFCYHQFKNRLYSVHPFQSLIKNKGYGEDASNCRQKYSRFKTNPLGKNEKIIVNGTQINPDKRIEKRLRNYHSIPIRIYSKLRRFLNI